MAKQMLISEYESSSSEQDLDPRAAKQPRVQQDEKCKSLSWQFCDEIMEEKSWVWSFTWVSGMRGRHLPEGAKPGS